MGNETGSRSYHIRDLEPILNFIADFDPRGSYKADFYRKETMYCLDRSSRTE